MLNTSQKNTHRTSSHLTKEEKLFKDLSVKTPMALRKANDECWAQLDNAVSSKLKNCNSLAERLDLLQNLIYKEADAGNIFCHYQPPKRNLARQSRRTKMSIQLIKKKMLTAQISTSFFVWAVDSSGAIGNWC